MGEWGFHRSACGSRSRTRSLRGDKRTVTSVANGHTNEEVRERPRERGAEGWLRARVVELEQALASIRRRQIVALGDDETAAASDRERVFQGVLRRLPTPVLVLAEDDVLLFANLAAARFFGTSFNASGQRSLHQCIDEHRAARLSSLRPSGVDDHCWLEALDGSGAVRCHAFLAPVDDYAVRCIQIDWNPDDRTDG